MISFPRIVHPIYPYSMDLICQTFPHLQDVWKHHLKPFILPSKEEMDRRRFIVQFALHRIFERRRTRRLRASHDAWKTTHTWYIQPGVIFCSARWFNSRQVPSSSFTIYSMLGNGSMCCQTLSVVSDDRDNRMISRFVYAYGNVNGFTLRGDGEIQATTRRTESILSSHSILLVNACHQTLCTHTQTCGIDDRFEFELDRHPCIRVRSTDPISHT